MTSELQIAVGIATVGRREVLSDSLRELARQRSLPDRVLICPVTEADIDRTAFADLPFAVEVVWSDIGLPAQRNAILDAVGAMDALIYFDDDFFAEINFIARVRELLVADANIVVATGELLADGIHGPGIPAAQARALLAAAPVNQSERLTDTYNAYGCNMVVRLAAVREHALRFDEALPLYAWQEDLDFSRRLAPFGRIVKSSRLTGVHLATKKGRNSGIRFGYSQIANPVYLIRKRTMSMPVGMKLMVKNILGNMAKSPFPESFVDRRGRLKGNFLALRDACSGRIDPQRILDIH